MQPKKRANAVTYVLLAVVVIIIGVFVMLSFMDKRINWSMSFLPEDENPYGTKIFHTLMKDIVPESSFHFIKDSTSIRLPSDPTTKCDNYFYIGSEYYADSADLVKILDFARNGNHVYIFSSGSGNMIFDSLIRAPTYDYTNDEYEDYEEYDNEAEVIEENDVEVPQEVTHYEEYNFEKKVYFVSDSIIKLNFYDQKDEQIPSPISLMYNFEKTTNEWPYFRDSLRTWQGDRIEPIGYFDEEYNNFIKVKYGKGTIYFHSTPLAFTNFHIRNDTAMNYCRDALKTFGSGDIYWDEDNRTYDYKAFSNHSDHTPGKPGEGPLEFILSEPGLRSAWYLLMLAVVLYLIFGARRKQRIIAVTKNLENTSIEYAEVLSHMFMKQKDHKKLVMMKMDLFKSFIRDRFNIRLPISMKDEDETLYREISQKSSVPFELVKEIFEQHKIMAAVVNVATPEMLEFHKHIEQFYTTCK